MRGRQLANVLEDGPRRDDVFVGQELVDRFEVDLAAHLGARQQRLDLGAEQQTGRRLRVVERLLAGAVARGQQRPRAAVPQRQREHAAKPAEKRLAVLFVGVRQHFDVGARVERVPLLLELAADLGEVVDLAVGDHLDGAVLVGERLLPAGEVHDRQPAHRQRDARQLDAALFVRAAVVQRADHVLHFGRGNGPPELRFDDADDAAHVQSAADRRAGDRLMTRAGTPAATWKSGTLSLTIAPAPMMASRPIRTPSVTTT